MSLAEDEEFMDREYKVVETQQGTFYDFRVSGNIFQAQYSFWLIVGPECSIREDFAEEFVQYKFDPSQLSEYA